MGGSPSRASELAERSVSELMAWATGRIGPTAFTIDKPSYAIELPGAEPQWLFYRLQMLYLWEAPPSAPALQGEADDPLGFHAGGDRVDVDGKAHSFGSVPAQPTDASPKQLAHTVPQRPGSRQLVPIQHVPAGRLLELRTEAADGVGHLFVERASLALMQLLAGTLSAREGVACCFATLRVRLVSRQVLTRARANCWRVLCPP